MVWIRVSMVDRTCKKGERKMSYQIGNKKRNFEDVEDIVIDDILKVCLEFRDGEAGTKRTIEEIIAILETSGEKID